MATIVTRAGKGSPLTHNEVDANFNNLNSDKAEISSLGTAAALDVGTSANNVVQLNGSAQLPAVDGSLLTGIATVPSGLIAIWSGSSANIPSGWVLCDGLNSTPDLRDRFVIGAGSTYTAGDTGGSATITDVPAHNHNFSGNADSGGDHSHTVTAATASDGAHNHNISGNTSNTGAHTHTYQHFHDSGPMDPDYAVPGGDNNGRMLNYTTTSNGAHSHTISGSTSSTGGHNHNVSGNTSSTGAHSHTLTGAVGATGSASVSVLNPFYALCYIMKT